MELKELDDVPSMCFGQPQSHLNRVIGEFSFDEFTNIRAYGSDDKSTAVLVSKRTCMPFALGMRSHGHKEGADGGETTNNNEHFTTRLARGLLGVEKHKHVAVGLLFQNGTYDKPDPDMFSPPSWCDE
jgi:hypothetical protein